MISESNHLKTILLMTVLSIISISLVLSNTISSITTLFLMTIASICILFCIKLFIRMNINFDKLILIFTISLGFFQSALFSVRIGPISLFPFRILFIVLFIWFVFKLVTSKVNTSHLNGNVSIHLGFFIFWLGYSILSLIWVKSLSDAINYIFLLAVGVFIVYFTVLYLKNSFDYIYLFSAWILVLIIIIGIGLWNHFTLNHLSSSYIYSAPEHKRAIPTSVFYNQNDFASYLAISIYFLFAAFKYLKNYILKSICLLLILLSCYLMYVTDSRASILAVVFGFLVLFFLYLPTKIKKLTIIATTLVGLFSSILFFNDILGFIGGSSSSIQEDNSLNIRTNLLKNSVDFVTNSFGFGVGAGNAEYYMENLSIYPTQGVLNVHNWWIEILVNNGVLVFVGYIILYLTILINLYSIFKTVNNRLEKMVCEALLGAFIAFIIASISPSSISNLNYHWILLAFAIGFIHVIKNKESSSI
ncbi:O-antigen ligase family protein [Metabacillus halosaccharovorans]|uniref:O-antigen ligase family protein n=1 Tax=Metabacillus halosaccharovorans TaxID=930124 RepID=UPI003735D576